MPLHIHATSPLIDKMHDVEKPGQDSWQSSGVSFRLESCWTDVFLEPGLVRILATQNGNLNGSEALYKNIHGMNPACSWHHDVPIKVDIYIIYILYSLVHAISMEIYLSIFLFFLGDTIVVTTNSGWFQPPNRLSCRWGRGRGRGMGWDRKKKRRTCQAGGMGWRWGGGWCWWWYGGDEESGGSATR